MFQVASFGLIVSVQDSLNKADLRFFFHLSFWSCLVLSPYLPLHAIGPVPSDPQVRFPSLEKVHLNLLMSWMQCVSMSVMSRLACYYGVPGL